MAAEPDLAARRELVRAAMQRIRHEIAVDDGREARPMVLLLALAGSVLP